MKTERANTWLTVGANVGVIVGLLFLAYEINQSTRATIAAASEGLTEQSLLYFSLRIDNETIAEASFKQNQGIDLEEYEEFQLELHQHLNFRVFENAYLQYRRGFYDDSEWDRYRRIIANLMKENESSQRMWDRTRGGWTAEFAAEVNGLIPEDPVAE